MGKNLPKFIRLPGDPQISPPYKFEKVLIRSFRLNADAGTLQKLVRRCLNIGNKERKQNSFYYDYSTERDFVDLDLLTYGSMESGAEGPEKKMGFMTQNELCFRLLVNKFDHDNKLEENAIFIPYIFVDNPWSVIAGREVIGYPKLYAHFDMPPLGPYPVTIKAHVFKKFGENEKLDLDEVVKIEAAGGSPPGSAFQTWPWGGDPPAGYTAPGQKPERKCIIQLKQFLDAKNHDNDANGRYDRACYQALVRAEISTKVRNPGTHNPDPLFPAKITIKNHPSLPLVEVLGLKGAVQQTTWAYKVECNMELYDAEVLFEPPEREEE